MMRYKTALALLMALVFIGLLIPSSAHARAMYIPGGSNGGNGFPKPAFDFPNIQFEYHNIGKIGMTIYNSGRFGTYGATLICDGEICPSVEYPIGSEMEYLFAGALWIGAIVGRDTLVSVGAEGWYGSSAELLPEDGPDGAFIRRSSLRSNFDYSDEALSEQDFIATFADTVVDAGYNGTDEYDNRPHIPIGFTIRQSSYAWSYEYAEDFILFDYLLTNVSVFPIKDLYMGLYVDADVYHKSQEAGGYLDDICGFRKTVKTPAGWCIDEDTVNIAWIADNDGDPVEGSWSYISPTAVTGVSVVRSPNPDLDYSFNWWISNGNTPDDFGPRYAPTDDDPFRTFPGGGLGTPTGDRTKYYIMQHQEFDYDQLFTAIKHTDVDPITGRSYLPPPDELTAADFANGYDTRYLLSFGPFDIESGDSIAVTLAYLAGADFHVNPNDFADYFDIYNPEVYYSKLSFKKFGENARWANWIFDNPGYDTDGDGDSGKFCWNYIYVYDSLDIDPDSDFLVSDSTKFYYRGDGIPDFRGASPPPPPVITVEPKFGAVTIRWNGEEAQNTTDVFSGQKDFEGFRVYYSEGEEAKDYILLTSFDLDDYKVNKFDTTLNLWEQAPAPLTLDSLHVLYGPYFDPAEYNSEFSYFENQAGELFYYIPQDWNQSDLRDQNLIHRVYPNASRFDPLDTTEAGFLRYYEYEYHIPNLQASKPYYFSVTSFDYGSLKFDLGALESSPLLNAVYEFPLAEADAVEENALKVIVYPNPYRIDGGYANAGYENRDRDKSSELTRIINFGNLPKVCTIRIYSIDGDLIREIEHYYPEGGPRSQHEIWNVISRNTQAVVTGIYYWHVESEMGEQLGKLVIMK